MNREFIPSTNPAAAVTAWEVSPCLEFPGHGGGGDVQAFENVEEAQKASDETAGPVFWGVYARTSKAAIAAGELPAVHVKDFDTHAGAMAFVRMMTGDAGGRGNDRMMAEAAATELLDAARECARSLQSFREYCRGKSPWTRRDQLALQDAEAAIEKAEGRN